MKKLHRTKPAATRARSAGSPAGAEDRSLERRYLEDQRSHLRRNAAGARPQWGVATVLAMMGLGLGSVAWIFWRMGFGHDDPAVVYVMAGIWSLGALLCLGGAYGFARPSAAAVEQSAGKPLRDDLDGPSRQALVRTAPGQRLAVRLRPLFGQVRGQVRALGAGIAVAAALLLAAVAGGDLGRPLRIFPPCAFVLVTLLVVLGRLLYRRIGPARAGLHTLVEVDRAAVRRGETLALFIEQQGQATIKDLDVRLVCKVKTRRAYQQHKPRRQAASTIIDILHDQELARHSGVELARYAPWQLDRTIAIPRAARQSGAHTRLTEVLWAITVSLTLSNGVTIEHQFPFQVV